MVRPLRVAPGASGAGQGKRRMGLNYHILDVFTERAFGGNPLAVVLEADHLTVPEMQAIAREFNLSETVFVLKATSPGHTARIRIFTPSREIPFAGHPTLGTAALLADLRMPVVNGESDAIIALEEEIGSVPRWDPVAGWGCGLWRVRCAEGAGRAGRDDAAGRSRGGAGLDANGTDL